MEAEKPDRPNEDPGLNRTDATTELPRLAPLHLQLAAYFRALAVGAGRLLLRPQKRGSTQVAAEYDQGAWRQALESRRWLTAASLSDYLFGDDETPLLVKLDKRIVLLPRRDYMRRRFAAIGELVARFGVAGLPLVELGCGPGSNLLFLASREPGRAFEGYDISPAALEVARMVQAHFGIANASFRALDLTDPGHPAWTAVTSKNVLTYFALEQMPDHIEGVVARLVARQPRRVIHVEPTTELLSPLRPLDWPIYFHVRSKDYQRSLFRTLERHAAAGELRLLHKGRLPIAPSLSNDGFVAVWEPTAASRP